MGKKNYLDFKRLYVEINAKAFNEFGEIEAIGNPMTVSALIENASGAPRGNFDLVYTNMLADFIELAGKRGTMIANILRKKDINNCVRQTAKSLCGTKDGNISKTTLYSFLKDANDKGYIALKYDGLMLNPQIMRRGNRAWEAHLTSEFERLRVEQEEKKEAKQEEEQEEEPDHFNDFNSE